MGTQAAGTFVLTPAVIDKLGFIQRLIAGARLGAPAPLTGA
jgi:hypothetical protein